METKRFFGSCMMAAVVTAGCLLTSCSEDKQEEVMKEFTTEGVLETLQSSDLANTRGLTQDGTTIKAVWKADDKVYAYPDGSNKSIGTLSPKADQLGTERTKLDGTLNSSGLKVGDYMNFLMPREEFSYTGQVGTLTDIEKKYDYAQSKVYITEIGTNSMKGSTAKFTSAQSIIRFTIKGADGKLMNIPNLTISAAGKKLVTSRSMSGGTFSAVYGDLEITPASATSELFVALSNDKEDGDTYTLLTTIGTGKYTYTRSNVTFKKGQCYHVTVTMSLNDDTYSERTGYGTEEEQIWD